MATIKRLMFRNGLIHGGTFASSPLGAPVEPVTPVAEEALEFRWGETPTYVTSTGTWTVPEDYEGYVLVYAIGGGGNGNSDARGGGGAGGCALSIFKAIPGTIFNVNITSSRICTISQADLLTANMVANKGSNGPNASHNPGGAGGSASGGNIGSWTGGSGGTGFYHSRGGGGGGIISGGGLTANGGDQTTYNDTHFGGWGAGWAAKESAINGDRKSNPSGFAGSSGGAGFAPSSDFIQSNVRLNTSTGTYAEVCVDICGGAGGIHRGTNTNRGGDGKNFAGGGGAYYIPDTTGTGGDGGYGGGGGSGYYAGTGGAAVAVFIISENGKWF